MNNYTIVFIPNNRLDEDDSADFKEWKNVSANSVDEVKENHSSGVLIISITKSL